MGTQGLKVYRHKGRYYVYYNHWDSYPEGLGLDLLRELPRNVSKEEFGEWLRKTREHVYAQRDSEQLNDPDDTENYVSDKPPETCDSAEWIYEIDLDNLVFHVNNHPLFRLDNMPPDDIFMDCLSFDHFGHRAFYEHTPAQSQFRYDWRSPPPTLTPESLAAYHSFHIRSSISSVHDLLDIPVALSSIERVRMTFMELLVTRRMTEYEVGRYARVLENVPDRDHIPESMLELAVFLVKFAVGPPIYSLNYHYCSPYDPDYDFVWIRNDACLRITTHLDDEDNLKASIGDLVHHINTKPDKVGTIYGVACSIFHCAIVRVDKDELGTSVAHTPAFQFLPSFYARTMFTPGIEALSRLGCQTSGVEFLDLISNNDYRHRNRKHTFTKYREFAVMTGSAAEKIPVEVWTRIGDFFKSSTDLLNLALISPQALLAAGHLTRYPWVKARGLYPNWIDEFRLEDVVSPATPIQEAAGRIRRRVIRKYYHQLGRAKFTAVINGQRLTVELVQDDEVGRHNHDEDEVPKYLVPGKRAPISYSYEYIGGEIMSHISVRF